MARFKLVNVYATNESQEKILFYGVLQQVLSRYTDGEFIVLGYFNCTIGATSGQAHAKREISAFKEMFNDLSLNDVCG
jgi:hypothetical protein